MILATPKPGCTQLEVYDYPEGYATNSRAITRLLRAGIAESFPTHPRPDRIGILLIPQIGNEARQVLKSVDDRVDLEWLCP